MSVYYKSLAKRTNPAIIPIFPLNGSVLFPGCDLPLNIFEPRYLNMIEDALRADRLIGMTQVKEEGSIEKIGSLGRITQFSEADDGRYLIVLKGLKRFRILQEIEDKAPYRQARISFDEFSADIDSHVGADLPAALTGSSTGDRNALTVAMKSFAKTLGVNVDWKALSEIPLPNLVDQASMISPFKPVDKQSLLEAKDTDERRRLLIGLMHLYASLDSGDSNKTQ